MSDGSTICPNCGHVYAEGRRCPQCGAAAPGAKASASALTGMPWLDVVLGILAGIVLSVTVLGVIPAIIVFFVLRRRHPYFAISVGVVCLPFLLLYLGILVACFSGAWKF